MDKHDLYWRFNVFQQAARDIWQIYGRVGFLDASGNPISGNRTGTIIAHYDGSSLDIPAQLYHINRNDLIKQYT